MPFKKDLLRLTSIFILLIIFLIFGGFYLLQGAYLYSTIILGSIDTPVHLDGAEREQEEREVLGRI